MSKRSSPANMVSATAKSKEKRVQQIQYLSNRCASLLSKHKALNALLLEECFPASGQRCTCDKAKSAAARNTSADLFDEDAGNAAADVTEEVDERCVDCFEQRARLQLHSLDPYAPLVETLETAETVAPTITHASVLGVFELHRRAFSQHLTKCAAQFLLICEPVAALRSLLLLFRLSLCTSIEHLCAALDVCVHLSAFGVAHALIGKYGARLEKLGDETPWGGYARVLESYIGWKHDPNPTSQQRLCAVLTTQLSGSIGSYTGARRMALCCAAVADLRQTETYDSNIAAAGKCPFAPTAGWSWCDAVYECSRWRTKLLVSQLAPAVKPTSQADDAQWLPLYSGKDKPIGVNVALDVYGYVQSLQQLAAACECASLPDDAGEFLLDVCAHTDRIPAVTGSLLCLVASARVHRLRCETSRLAAGRLVEHTRKLSAWLQPPTAMGPSPSNSSSSANEDDGQPPAASLSASSSSIDAPTPRRSTRLRTLQSSTSSETHPTDSTSLTALKSRPRTSRQQKRRSAEPDDDGVDKENEQPTNGEGQANSKSPRVSDSSSSSLQPCACALCTKQHTLSNYAQAVGAARYTLSMMKDETEAAAPFDPKFCPSEALDKTLRSLQLNVSTEQLCPCPHLYLTAAADECERLLRAGDWQRLRAVALAHLDGLPAHAPRFHRLLLDWYHVTGDLLAKVPDFSTRVAAVVPASDSSTSALADQMDALSLSGRRSQADTHIKQTLDRLRPQFAANKDRLYWPWTRRCAELLMLLSYLTGDTESAAFYMSETYAVSTRTRIRDLRSERRKWKREADGDHALVCHADADALRATVDAMPSDWAIAHLHVTGTWFGRLLFVCRMAPRRAPLIFAVRPLAKEMAEFTDDFKAFHKKNTSTVQLKNPKQFWDNRHFLDDYIKKYTARIEQRWLAEAVYLLLHVQPAPQLTSRLASIVGCTHRAQIIAGALCTRGGAGRLSDLLGRLGLHDASLRDQVVEVATAHTFTVAQRSPLILVASDELRCFPWECLPALCAVQQPCTRAQSVHILRRTLVARPHRRVRPPSTFYIVDPANNLAKTRMRFEALCKSQPGWTGLAKMAPSKDQLLDALRSKHVLLYCGHGDLGKYVSRSSLRMSDASAVAVLAGCASVAADFAEPYFEGVGRVDNLAVAAKLVATGCNFGFLPCTLGFLWLGTDLEFDRCMLGLLLRWLLHAKTDQQKQAILESAAGCKVTEDRAAELLAVDRVDSLLQLLAAQRQSESPLQLCKLRHLTNGALVSYGLPVDTSD